MCNQPLGKYLDIKIASFNKVNCIATASVLAFAVSVIIGNNVHVKV